jgi:gliding motility-associated-like protein
MVLTATANEAKQTATLDWTAYQGFATLREYELYQKLENQGAFSPLRDKPVVAANIVRVVSETGGDAFNQSYRIKTVDPATGEVSYSNIANLSFKNALIFYNVITPNGDEQNDDLNFENLKLYPVNTLRIYNRWGRLVYETNNYQGGYAPAEGGVYTYIFTTNGTSKKGWFEVVK